MAHLVSTCYCPFYLSRLFTLVSILSLFPSFLFYMGPCYISAPVVSCVFFISACSCFLLVSLSMPYTSSCLFSYTFIISCFLFHLPHLCACCDLFSLFFCYPCLIHVLIHCLPYDCHLFFTYLSLQCLYLISAHRCYLRVGTFLCIPDLFLFSSIPRLYHFGSLSNCIFLL